jgi:hypothetical protein
MPRRYQKQVILVGLLAILFVQICPLFEDPTPLTKVRQPFAPIVVVFLLLSLAVIAHRRPSDYSSKLDSAVPVLDLTCVRLC